MVSLQIICIPVHDYPRVHPIVQLKPFSQKESPPSLDWKCVHQSVTTSLQELDGLEHVKDGLRIQEIVDQVWGLTLEHSRGTRVSGARVCVGLRVCSISEPNLSLRRVTPTKWKT